MKLSHNDIILLALFVQDVTHSHSFVRHSINSEYRRKVLDLEDRLIKERERLFNKSWKRFEKDKLKK